MLKFINPAGGTTWAHESRMDEYLERGYKLAPRPEPEPRPVEGFKAPKKPPAKKRTTKKEA